MRQKLEKNKTILYGASDDLIEVESSTAGSDEFYGNDDKGNYVTFSDGTVLHIVYSGTWDITLIQKGTSEVSIEKNKGSDSDQYSDVATLTGEITSYKVTKRKIKAKKESVEFYMQWREDFDDQEGWFTASDLEKEIKRIRMLEDDEDGEATIYSIVKGKDVTEEHI